MFARLRRWLGLAPAPVEVAEGLWEAVEARLPFLDFLAPADRLRLREMAKRFLASKQFYGAQGLQLTDDILLGIALQACLPVLNIGLDAYRGWVGVVVYPGDFVIPRREMDDSGVVHEYDDEVLGEAWEGGPVLLSWFAINVALVLGYRLALRAILKAARRRGFNLRQIAIVGAGDLGCELLDRAAGDELDDREADGDDADQRRHHQQHAPQHVGGHPAHR